MQTAQLGWGAKAESIEGSELAGKALARGWVYAPLGVPMVGGVPSSIFPRFFKKKGVRMEEQEKLKRELHSGSLSLLRQGFTLQAIIHAMIVESERLSDSANVVEAIEEYKFKP